MFKPSTMSRLPSHSCTTPASNVLSQPQNTVPFQSDVITMSMRRSMRPGTNNADPRGGLAALGEMVPEKVRWSVLAPCWKHNGQSSCPVSKPRWTIRRCVIGFLTHPGTSSAEDAVCHSLAFLLLHCSLGVFALCRDYSALLRVSRLVFASYLGSQSPRVSIVEGLGQRVLLPFSKG